MNEQEIEALVNELTAAGATEQEIATILDEKLAQSKQSSPPPTEPITTQLPSNTASNGGAQEGKAGFHNLKVLFPKLGQDVSEGVGMVNRGLTQVVSEPLKFAGALEQSLGVKSPLQIFLEKTGAIKEQDHFALQLGKAVEDISAELNPVSEEFQQSTTGQVLQGVGQAGGMIASGGFSSVPQLAAQTAKTGFLPAALETAKAVGKTAVSRPGFIGGSMVAAPEWEAAKAAGQTDEQAFNTLISNYFVGQTEVLPIQNILGKLNKATGNTLINTVKNMGSGGLQEGLQEGIQTYLTNQIASGTYDPDRDPLFQVLESAKVGGIVGLILPGVGAALQSAPKDSQQKLTGKIIELSANGAIANTDTGDQNINLEIDKSSEINENQKQVIEDAVQVESPATLPVQPEAGGSQEVSGTQPQAKPEVTAQQKTQESVAEQGDIDVTQLVKEFNETGVLLGQEPGAEPRPVIAEQVADFLRSKNITDEAKVNEFIDEFNALPIEGKPILKIADAKRAYELLAASKPKPFDGETVERTVNEEIKRISQERVKGKTEGTRIGQDFKNTLVSKVQEAMKESNLTPKQINSILTRVRRTNAFTAGSVSNLRSFVDKVMVDANYADQVDLAYNLKSKIKKQAKSKEIPQNIRSTSKEFAKLDLESFDSVEDYTQLAEHITSGMSSPKGNKYSGFDEFKVTEKINEAKRNQEKAQLAQMLSDFADFDVDEIIADDTSIEETLKANEARRTEIMEQLTLRTQVAKESLETAPQEEFGPEEKATVTTMLNADPATMSAADMVSYIRIADNIVINNDFSGAGVIEAKLKAEQVGKELLALPRNNKVTQTNALTAGTADFYSVGQLMDAMVNNQRTVADIEQKTGIAGAFEAGSVTNNMSQEKVDSFKDLLASIKRKYKNKPDPSHIEEQWKGVVLSELARNTDDTSHLPKVKANLERSIQLYTKVDPKLGKKMQEYYQPYKNVLSSTETIERFKKNDPQIHEIWQWFRENVFDEGLTLAAKNTTNKIYNQSLVAENNYLPSSQKRIEKQAKSAEESDGNSRLLTLKPQQAKNTLRATRSLAQGHGYNLNWFGGLFRAYHNTLYDINSAKHIQLLYEVSKRPEFEQVIGGIENKNAILTSLEKRLADQRGDTTTEGNFVKMFNNVAHILKDLGVAKALGGIDQIVTQTVPTWMSASINLGSDANLMFVRVPKTFISDVIGKSRTSEAGRRKGGTDLGESSERYLSDETKGGVKIVEDIRRGVKGAADFSLIPLTKGDVFVRRQAFAGFYTQRLIEQGIDPKTIDLSKEGQKQHEKERQVARAYADHMIATLQVPSNRAEMGEFLTRKGGWDTLRTILFPFSVFPVNTKIRFTRAVNKLASNPSEGKKELASVVAESITFGAIKTYFLAAIVYPKLAELIRAGLGLEEPEKEEDRSTDLWAGISDKAENIKNFRKLSTSVFNDVMPTSIGPGSAMTAYMANYTAYAFRGEDAQDQTYDEWLAETRGLVNQPYESEFSNWGVLGVGSQQLKDIGDAWYDVGTTLAGSDMIYYNTMFGTEEAEVQDVKDLIYWNGLMETMSIVTPREFDNAWKKVYVEQLKDYTPTRQRSFRQSQQSNRRP